MRVGDVVEIVAVPTVMQLDATRQLRERLDVDLVASAEAVRPRDGAAGAPQAELRRLLCDYVLAEPESGNGGHNGDGSAAVALRTTLESVCRRDGGAGLLIDGVHGSGKTHFLSVLALLLEYSEARHVFAEAHPDFRDLLDRLDRQPPILVVPVSLDQHRGRSELLEDIVFDATEAELARPRYAIHLPLSAQSHALHLVDQYVAPRYRHELDARVRREGSLAEAPAQVSLSFGDGEWGRLRRAEPGHALQVARQFLSEINYPLDFRQSRVQRLDRLTAALRENAFGGVVWLVDELGLFLRSAEPKALASDCGFLQFLGQRTQTQPVWFIGTMRRSVETLQDLSPHAIQQVRERYKTGLSLSASNVRAVLRGRVLRRRDPRTFDRTIAGLYARWKQRFPQLTFTQEQLADAYPLHPMTMDCLEAAAGRFLSRARSAIDFVQARVAGDPHRALAGILDQHVATLVTPDVLFDHFAGQIAQSAVPVGAYVGEVHEYFVGNIASLLPGQAGLGMRTVKTLLMLRATSQEAAVKRVTESVMLAEPEGDACPYATLHALLQQLAQRTPYVRRRKGDDDPEDIYFIDVPPRGADGLRHRVATAKSVLADDDPRIVEHALRACRTAIFPISNFRDTKVVELEWRNTRRHAAIVQVNTSALSTAQLADAMQRLADPETRESCQVFIGVPFRAEEQIRHWQAICRDLPSSRWRGALVAWIPRTVEAGELLRLKEYAAARMVHDVGARRRTLPADDGDAAAPESADIEALMRELYAEGTLVTAGTPRGDTPSPSLPAVKDDWGSLLRYVCGLAFDSVYRRFPDVMPTTRLAGPGQINCLIADVIFADGAAEGELSRLRAMARTHLGPMRLASESDGRIVLSASGSPVAQMLYGFVTRRDTTQRDAAGQPVALERLLQLMAKSELGLPHSMSRLAVAVLLRLGYLQALDASRRPVRLPPRRRQALAAEPEPASALLADDPLGAVAYVARAPLLAHHEWQQAAAIARGLLGMPLAAPDWPVQQALWEKLTAAREHWETRLQQLRSRLDDLRQALGQDAEQWAESYGATDAARSILSQIDPSLPAADGLRRLIAGCRELSGRLHPGARPVAHGDRPLAPALAQVVGRVEAIETFLADNAQPIIQMHGYLSRIELPERATAQGTQRDRLLRLIASGEGLVGRAAIAAQAWRSFQAAYARVYVAWHQRCHNAGEFQRYQQLRSMPAYRALQQFSKLSVPTQVGLKDIDETLDAQRARQCTNDALGEELRSSPVCARCQLRLGASLELVPPDEVAQLIHQSLAEHIAAIKAPQIRQALMEYAASCPTAELGSRIRALIELSPDIAPPRLLAMLSNELIGHVRRAIGGQRIHTRRLEALREQLGGKMVTKAELNEALRKWLDERDELATGELIHIE